MSKSQRITLSDSAPTLLFSGVGSVFIVPAAGSTSAVYIGGDDVTPNTGIISNSIGGPLVVSSPDKIYGIAAAGYAADAIVFNVR